jgi:hypothetical protein
MWIELRYLEWVSRWKIPGTLFWKGAKKDVATKVLDMEYFNNDVEYPGNSAKKIDRKAQFRTKCANFAR